MISRRLLFGAAIVSLFGLISSSSQAMAGSFNGRPPCERDALLNGGTRPPATFTPYSDFGDPGQDAVDTSVSRAPGGIPGRDTWVWPTSSYAGSGGGSGAGGGEGGGSGLPEPPGEGFQPMYQHGQFVGWYTPEQVARSQTDFAGVLREVVNGPYYYGGASGRASILYEIGDIDSPFMW